MVKRYRKEDSISYTLGTTITIELLKMRPELVDVVYYHSDLRDVSTIADLCALNKIQLIQNDKPFNILSQKENCYVIGVFRKKMYTLQKDTNHVVLVNPSNAGNLGTILRSAVGFGIEDIAIISPAVDIYDPKTVRSSMGALFNIRFHYYDTWEDYLSSVNSRSLYPFMLKAKFTLKQVVPQYPCSLIFGNEATGLPDSFLDVGDPLIIQHTHRIDSLNLPIACSIALFRFFSETDLTK